MTEKEHYPDGLTKQRKQIVLKLSLQMPYVKTTIAGVDVETPLDKSMQQLKQTLSKIHHESTCQHCGDRYEINYRLNDGYCNDCREGLNRENFDD